MQRNGSSRLGGPKPRPLSSALLYGDALQLIRRRPRLRSRPKEETLLPLEDMVNDVGAEQSEDVNEVITEPDLPTFEPEEEPTTLPN